MKTYLTTVIILDASGSMANKAQEVVSGLRKKLEDIQKEVDVDTVNTVIVTSFASPGDFQVLVNTSAPE